MRSRASRRAAALALVLGAAALQLARPLPSRGGAVLRRLDLTPGAPMCSGIALCGPSDACTDVGTTCQDFPGLGASCVEPGQDLYCCGSAACPPIEGVSASSCAPVVNTETGVALSVCLYPHFDLCDPTLTLDRVRACFTDVDGALVTSWAEGNCDGDALPNGADPDPCAVFVGPVDAGVLLRDGGPVARDAGAGGDAGPMRDGGARSRDGGTARPDASTRTLDVSFRGGGGCVCSAPGAGLRT